MSQTQQERKAETRARLLDAAAELFADQGIDAVSVDAVAEAAGRTSGAVYAHFGSKQGLLRALLDWRKDSLLALLFAEVAVTSSPHRQLEAVWDNVAGDHDGTSARWSLLEHELWLRAARDPDVAELFQIREAESRRYSARRLAAWTSQFDADPAGSPEDVAVLMKALLTGLAMQRRLDPTSVSDDLAVRGLAALVGLPIDRPTSESAAGSPSAKQSYPSPPAIPQGVQP